MRIGESSQPFYSFFFALRSMGKNAFFGCVGFLTAVPQAAIGKNDMSVEHPALITSRVRSPVRSHQNAAPNGAVLGQIHSCVRKKSDARGNPKKIKI